MSAPDPRDPEGQAPRQEPRQAALALDEASQALVAALGGEDDAEIARALARREAGLCGLAEALEGRTGVAEDVISLVEEVRRRDAGALALAKRRLAEVGAELEKVRRARAVARSLAAAEEPARFVDKRV